MKDDLSTPEELGEKLKRGEITKEDAIEIMSERARREAFAGLYAPVVPPDAAGKPAGTPRRRAWKAVAAFAAFLIGALVLLWVLLWLLG